jgi:predicted Zn-dependent protease
MKRWQGTFVVAALALLSLAAGGCSTNPVTQERTLMFLSPQQEVALGQEAAPQFSQEFGGPYGDPVMQEYVRGVGAKVAAHAVSADYPYEYTFTVLDSDVVNAFALPGGPIFITRGLLFQLGDESQLAAVLAHEATHVAARHSAQQISQQMSVSVLISIASAALSRGKTGGETSPAAAEQVAGLVANLANLRYSRKHETESDTFGLDYMIRAGYNPLGMVRVMEMFQRMEQQGGAGGPEFLRTHPSPENRVEAIQARINEKYPTSRTDPRLVVGTDAYRQKVLSRQSLVGQYSKSVK